MIIVHRETQDHLDWKQIQNYANYETVFSLFKCEVQVTNEPI